VHRRRLQAAVVLAAHVVALAVVPSLHRMHHAAHGADHRHTVDGTIWERPPSAATTTAAPTTTAAHAHAALDADLEALDLAEVADAGVLAVDCALAEYTLATCDGSLPADHAHRFGDELVAHHHPTTPSSDFDPDHARGALAHLAAPLAEVAVPLVPPPPAPRIFVYPAEPAAPAVAPRAVIASARAPPTTTL
jgi:hypothetical protein